MKGFGNKSKKVPPPSFSFSFSISLLLFFYLYMSIAGSFLFLSHLLLLSLLLLLLPLLPLHHLPSPHFWSIFTKKPGIFLAFQSSSSGLFVPSPSPLPSHPLPLSSVSGREVSGLTGWWGGRDMNGLPSLFIFLPFFLLYIFSYSFPFLLLPSLSLLPSFLSISSRLSLFFWVPKGPLSFFSFFYLLLFFIFLPQLWRRREGGRGDGW